MNLAKFLAALAVAGLIAAPAYAELFAAGPADLKGEVAAAAKQGKQLVVLFEMDDCPACRKLKQNVLSDTAAEKAFERDFRTASVNVSRNGEITLPDGKTQTPAAWADRLRILGTPAIAFFDKDGQLLYRHVGPLADGRELLLLGRYVASAEYERRPFVSYLSAQKPGKRASTEIHGSICRTRS